MSVLVNAACLDVCDCVHMQRSASEGRLKSTVHNSGVPDLAV